MLDRASRARRRCSRPATGSGRSSSASAASSGSSTSGASVAGACRRRRRPRSAGSGRPRGDLGVVTDAGGVVARRAAAGSAAARVGDRAAADEQPDDECRRQAIATTTATAMISGRWLTVGDLPDEPAGRRTTCRGVPGGERPVGQPTSAGRRRGGGPCRYVGASSSDGALLAAPGSAPARPCGGEHVTALHGGPARRRGRPRPSRRRAQNEQTEDQRQTMLQGCLLPQRRRATWHAAGVTRITRAFTELSSPGAPGGTGTGRDRALRRWLARRGSAGRRRW